MDVTNNPIKQIITTATIAAAPPAANIATNDLTPAIIPLIADTVALIATLIPLTVFLVLSIANFLPCSTTLLLFLIVLFVLLEKVLDKLLLNAI